MDFSRRSASFLLVLCLFYNSCAALPTQNETMQNDGTGVQRASSVKEKTLKIGDNCSSDSQCKQSISGPVLCNITTESCSCPESHPVSSKSKIICLEKSYLGDSCTHDEQCLYKQAYSTCNKDVCECLYLYEPSADNSTCVYKYNREPDGIDFTMLGILIGLIFMFIVLCVVLQMFSRAQFKNQRTIFNSPHPRLLRIKLGKKRSHLRRGSRQASTGTPTSPRLSRQGSRAGSRVASRESLHSSNGLGKTNPAMINQKQGVDDFLIPPTSPNFSKKTSPERSTNGPVRV